MRSHRRQSRREPWTLIDMMAEQWNPEDRTAGRGAYEILVLKACRVGLLTL